MRKINNLPVYQLEINDEMSSDAMVEMIALVDSPAIQKNFIMFREQFVRKLPGENRDHFLARCIPTMIHEGKPNDQAVAMCQSMYDQFAGDKISFDWDETLSTERGKQILQREIDKGSDIYIISARGEITDLMKSTAEKYGIPADHIFATGSNKSKVEKIKELGIVKHWDNNPDVVSELGYIGQKFSSFSISDEQIITGPIMLADVPIYRNDAQDGHYVVFSADTIKRIALKFFKKGFQQNVNLEHDKGQTVAGVTMFESWIVDPKRGVQPMTGFEDVPIGSWFGSFKVENNDVWQKIKSGEVKGFSVEGIFAYKQPEQTIAEQTMSKIYDILSQVN